MGSTCSVNSSDIDNTTPTGGVSLTALSGLVSSAGGDGRGTISFGSNSIEISGLGQADLNPRGPSVLTTCR